MASSAILHYCGRNEIWPFLLQWLLLLSITEADFNFTIYFKSCWIIDGIRLIVRANWTITQRGEYTQKNCSICHCYWPNATDEIQFFFSNCCCWNCCCCFHQFMWEPAKLNKLRIITHFAYKFYISVCNA